METPDKTNVEIRFNNFPPETIASIMETLRQKQIQIRENITITLLNPHRFDMKRQMSLWYGGDMVEIEIPAGKFIISACGDNYATLTRRRDNTELFYVKDKNNRGDLGEELLLYLQTDKELTQLINDEHQEYQMEMDHNNWWECFGITKTGDFRDLMWALDADFITDAIVEVIHGYRSNLLV